MSKSSLKSNDALKQVLYHRRLMELTGELTAFQKNQLALWPKVLFPHAKSTEVVVKNEDQLWEVIVRIVTQSKVKAPKDISQRYSALDQWIKTLLGPVWLTTVKVNNKIVFTGDRKVYNE